MPKIDTLEEHKISGSHYGYSAKRVQDLGASEYTLVVIACDNSGSTEGFAAGLEACVKEVVTSCRRSPRADNLMLRYTTFHSTLREIHGFRPLMECDLDKYTGSIRTGGMTALYDASKNAIESCSQYGKALTAQDFDANAIVVILTDGLHNATALTANEVAAARDGAVKGEHLESLVTILVGVNVTDPTVSKALAEFKVTGKFDQYVELNNATERTLAKLAKFVSQSVSSQSSALKSGGPSKAIDPNSLGI